MIERRRRGEGSIELLPSGRYRARMPGDRHTMGPFDTPEEAGRVLDAAREMVADRKLMPVKGRTLRDVGDAFITRKIRRGVRGTNAHESKLAHVLDSKFADWSLEEITVLDVDRWIDALSQRKVSRGSVEKTIAKSYVRQVFGMLVALLDDAQVRGLVPQNVARLAEVPEDDDEEGSEPWTYLQPDEQEQLFAKAFTSRTDWLTARIALGTGLRAGELVTLGLEDVHLDSAGPYIRVRWGSVKSGKRRSTKSRKARNVPLFGMALEAMREWLDLLPRAFPKNPHALVFPRERGGFRDSNHILGRQKKILDRWQLAVERAGIGRNVRWHDLRHTCASSLIAGWWGERWTPVEVQKLLGHSSLRTTERYTHLGESVLQERARATTGPVSLAGPELPTNFPRVAKPLETSRIEVNPARGCSQALPVDSATYVPSWAVCGKSASSEARNIVANLAAGEPPSADSVQALCESVEEAVRASHPLLAAVDRVQAGGRYLTPALLALCGLVLSSEDASALLHPHPQDRRVAGED